jgi:hypothetical protein
MGQHSESGCNHQGTKKLNPWLSWVLVDRHIKLAYWPNALRFELWAQMVLLSLLRNQALTAEWKGWFGSACIFSKSGSALTGSLLER